MAGTILITGASSGIGKTTAKLFAEKGWNVVATMRSPEKEKELTELDNVLVTRLDVTDDASVRAAAAAGIAKFGKIDVLLNNAAYGAFGPLEATPEEQISQLFDTNVMGLIRTTKAILPHFRANRDGTIINVSSAAGRISFPLGTLYSGTKYAVEGLSESLSYEMRAIGVKVKIIEPGMVNTDFSRSQEVNNDERLTEYRDIVDKYRAAVAQFAAMTGGAAGTDPMVIAEAIYQAATDGTSQLRYVVGNDAKTALTARAGQDDDAFIAGVNAQFGL